MLKTISYNVLIFFVVANVLYWAIPTVTAIGNLIGGRRDGGIPFQSFLGWRYPQRATANDQATGTRTVHFFGGSTMFGLGVPESQTIPSHFAGMTRVRAENLGVIGYTAHQSLVLLLQLLQDGLRPEVVVFYDGVNDVAFKCERGMTPYSHDREREIRTLLSGQDSPSSFTSYFRPVVRLAERINREFDKAVSADRYDCDTDHAKAAAVANNLIRDWQFARLLTESAGGRFVGILQPVAFFSRSRTGHLTPPPGLDRQYQAVYARVRDHIAKTGEFHDLVDALDIDEALFTDYNHVTGKGNALIAGRIAKLVPPASP